MAEKKKGNDTKVLALVAVVIVLAIAGATYFGQGGKAAPPQNETPKAAPLETPAAKLLLSAFDAGARMRDFGLAYAVNENGATSAYQLRSAGINSWVNISGSFGNLQGYFGGNNASDVLCLTYAGESRCALAQNNSDAAKIAASLKIQLPDAKTFLAQKSQIAKLINVGAIKLDAGAIDERVGDFDAQKIAYSLDYRKLTVDQLASVGISPSDPSLASVSDQKVSYWIDRKTGMIVRSRATFKENLIPNTYETEYSELVLGETALPPAPKGVVETASFVAFYKRAESDFTAKQSCLNLAAGEQAACLKSMAAQRRDWEVCRLISDKKEYEACTLIVAQSTNNYVLCGKLELYADDCHISVAGQTGNFELCRNLKNASLIPQCAKAATEGTRKASLEQEALRKALEYRNCAVESDCGTFGNANQYCAPKNSTIQAANGSSAVLACFKNLPCGCNEGYCGFRKNDTYYQCINNAEEAELEKYIKDLADKKNSTAG